MSSPHCLEEIAATARLYMYCCSLNAYKRRKRIMSSFVMDFSPLDARKATQHSNGRNESRCQL